MKKSIPKVTIYSDGWAVPNPWKAGYGIILCYKNIKKEFYQWYKLSTNNRMEMIWVITALKKLKKQSEVEVYTDSKYTIDGIEKWWAKKWKKNNWMRTSSQKAVNYDLWEQMLELIEKHNVKFHWVKWHNGHIENERCDELATLALNGKNLIEDTWYDGEEIKQVLQKWEKKKNTNKISKEGDICWKCETPVIKKIPKKKKLRPDQEFYYEYFFYCPGCKTNYMIPEGKRKIERN